MRQWILIVALLACGLVMTVLAMRADIDPADLDDANEGDPLADRPADGWYDPDA